MNQHPLSAAFPSMTDEDFQTLKDSIDAIGVQNPVTIYEGQIIDGWHRYRAAQELCINCPTAQLDPETDPREFVLAQNKARRHIDKSQRALATTAVYAWAAHGTNRHEKKMDIQYPSRIEIKTTAQLADIAGVHPHTIKQAKAVHADGAAEVVEAVREGKIGLPAAAVIAKLPQAAQAAALAQAAAPKPRRPKHSKPEPVAKPDEIDSGPSAAELDADEAARKADQHALDLLLSADDKLAAAHAEITRLNHVCAQLQMRINGLVNEKTEAVSMVKSLRRKLEKLEGQAA